MNAYDLTQEVIQLRRRTAETRALLFRMDPTPERLSAWADAYALLPESDML